MAAISWNLLWVGTGWVPTHAGAPANTIARAGAVLGRMLGAGSGLPVTLPSVSRDKCQGGRR